MKSQAYATRQISTTRFRQRRIAILLPWRAEYAERLMEGILRYQNDNPQFVIRDFLFNEVSFKIQVWSDFPKLWVDWHPEAIVANITEGDMVELLRSAKLPIVNIGSGCVTRFPSVYIDPDLLMAKAVTHLKAIGRKNIAFVGSTGVTPLWTKSLNRLFPRDSELPHCYFVERNDWFSWDSTLEYKISEDAGLIKFLSCLARPFGVIAANDNVGRVVCQACERIGVLIPHHAAILSIDDTRSARSCVPPLSSIHTPGEEVGYRAADLIMRMLDDQDMPKEVRVPPGRVVVRHSTSTSENSEAVVQRAMQLIQDLACTGANIEQILDKMNISRSTLERHFSATMGRTPSEELVRVRFSRAKELLRTTDLSLDAIAAHVGYTNSNNFITFFRKQSGVTPTSFRSEILNTQTLRKRPKRA